MHIRHNTILILDIPFSGALKTYTHTQKAVLRELPAQQNRSIKQASKLISTSVQRVEKQTHHRAENFNSTGAVVRVENSSVAAVE